MSYRFESDETIRAGLTRCAAEQLDAAVGALDAGSADPGVHDVRKAIKQLRSLLRLVRGSLDPDTRRRENRALREVARTLSEARDVDAMIETLDGLSVRYAGQVPERTFDLAHGALERRRAEQAVRAPVALLADGAREQLAAIRGRVDRWALRDDGQALHDGGFDALDRGLRRSYRNGRKAFERLRDGQGSTDDGPDDKWHQWRKRAKDLWYQERLLGGVAGPALTGAAKDVHELADLLGSDHDLVVLRQALVGGGLHVAADVDAIAGLIDHRRHQLHEQAIQLGARVYAEKPRAFAARARIAWRAGRGQAVAAVADQPGELAYATRRRAGIAGSG